MAAEEGVVVVQHAPPHEAVAEAFVEQYYHLLGTATHLAHRLYVDSSVITRPGPDGTVLSFTSLEAIKNHYLTCEYKGTTYDVVSVDSQRSLQDGIIIMVIGFLTGHDNLKRKFSQTFCLAPQDSVHVVVNDMYRFVDEEDSSPPTATLPPAVVESVVEPVDEISKTEPVQKVDAPAKKPVNAAEVKKVVAGATPPVTAQKPKEPVAETAAAPLDGAKMSYAAMVQSLSRSAAPFQAKAAPVQKVKSMVPSPKARAPPASAAAAVGKPEKKSGQRIVDEPGTSVFVSNLPMDAKPPQLYELFKEFGPMKEGGVQIRSSRASGRCFGFVSFESVESVQSMLKAAKSNPFKLGEHKLRVKEKQVEYDGSKPSGGRSGAGNKAQNGSVDESKTPTGSVDESKTPTGSADGSKSENGSSAGGGEDDDGFKTIRSRRNRRGNGDKKNSTVAAPKVKA